MRPRACPWMMGLALLLATAGRSWAEEPLHEKIDRLIEAGRPGRFAAPATDGEFLRRATLDLNGMIPTAVEARAFLDDPSPYKGDRLIDDLLERPEYARRLAIAFDVALMERRPDTHVPAAQWQEFLRAAFAANMPYNELARTILGAEDDDPDHRGPSKFYLDRLGEPTTLTRDVGRLFLGRDMTCAQCHDHVLYDDYKQAHYYGLYAFFSRSYLVQDARGVTHLAEKADGDVTFKSVFNKKVTHATGPRLIDGPPPVEPTVAKGQEYHAYPGDRVRAIPTHSRRALLSPLVASGKVPEFNRNIANRLWALMMGRGLVHPLDLDHSDNPPSNPELLDLLTSSFVAMGYDVRAFLRELALTRAYRRSSEPHPGLSPGESGPGSLAVATLRPLTPEQFAWSLMQATGIVAATRADAERRLLGLDPKFRAITEADATRSRLGRELVEKEVFARLEGNSGPFIRLFGRPAGTSQDAGDATVHQALFLANGDPVHSWLAGLANQLNARAEPSALAEELYLAVLTRRPTADERAEVTQHLAARTQDRPQAIQELAWALVTSAEFRFNH